MKRLLILLCVVGLLAAIPLSHMAMAAPAAKVKICHITGTGFNSGGKPVFVGHVVEVSASAVPAHCAHGDHNVGEDKEGHCQRQSGPNPAKIRKCGIGENEADAVSPPWYEKKK